MIRTIVFRTRSLRQQGGIPPAADTALTEAAQAVGTAPHDDDGSFSGVFRGGFVAARGPSGFYLQHTHPRRSTCGAGRVASSPTGSKGAAVVFRRLFRARPGPVTIELHPDDLPKRGLFAEPIRVSKLDVLPVETLDDGQRRATFLVEVKDAEDRRCPDLAVEATVSGPERTATVQGNTDMMGRVRFRMAGPPGAYGIHLDLIAMGGLDWDADAGPRAASTGAP
jgi:hypothetical protein